MKAALLYLAAPLLAALLSPLAVAREIAPYPPLFLIGTVPVVCAFTLLVAMPLYFMLPKAKRTHILWMTSIAFIAGTVSFALFGMGLHATYERIGTVVLIEDGNRTPEGWKLLLSQSIWMGCLSVPSGLLFLAAARTEARAAGNEA